MSSGSVGSAGSVAVRKPLGMSPWGAYTRGVVMEPPLCRRGQLHGLGLSRRDGDLLGLGRADHLDSFAAVAAIEVDLGRERDVGNGLRDVRPVGREPRNDLDTV